MAGFGAKNRQPLPPAVEFLRKEITKDPDTFIQEFYHITDKTGHDRVLKYRYGQRLVARWRQECMRKYGYFRGFILKSRRIGITTTAQAYFGILALCQDNVSVVTVAHLESRAIDIQKQSRYAYNNLPPELQLAMSSDSDEKREYRDTGSKQMIISAQSDDALRSGTHQHVGLSEWALCKNPMTLLKEVNKVCERFPGNSVLIETTGRGEGSDAHKYWQRCRRGQEGFEAMFLPWQKDQECCVKFINDRDRENKLKIAFDYNPELAELAEMYANTDAPLSAGNIVWGYQTLKDDCLGDWEDFREEYPCSEDEAWRSKGGIYFGSRFVAKLGTIVQQFPYDTYLFEHRNLEGLFNNPETDLTKAPRSFDPLRHDNLPNLMVFRGPQPGRHYVVSGDSAGGGVNGDPSSSHVIDMYSGEHMAEFDGVILPHQHANVIASLCRWYNGALAAPEANNHGQVTVMELARAWPRIYQFRALDKTNDKGVGARLGWWTFEGYRDIMLSLAKRVVEEVARGKNPLASGMIKSPRLVDQMRSFRENEKNGKPEAVAGAHDDSIMAYAIAWIVCSQETRGAHNDIITMLRPPEVNRQLQVCQPSIIVPKFDVAAGIAQTIAGLTKNWGTHHDMENVDPSLLIAPPSYPLIPEMNHYATYPSKQEI